MGTIASAEYQPDASPKNVIKISGFGLKADAKEDDVELWQSVLGFGNPTIVTISDDILCIFTAGFYTSDKPGVKVRMRGDDNTWTNQVDVT